MGGESRLGTDWVLETGQDSWWFGRNLKFCHFPSYHQKEIRLRELILIEVMFCSLFPINSILSLRLIIFRDVGSPFCMGGAELIRPASIC